MTRRRALLLATALGASLRAPFWQFALRAPIDADTAITGLMARHPFASASLWGQPYGSPLEAWLAEPFLLLFGANALAMRLLYFALGLALVPLAFLLAEAVDERAALPAGLLAACPPSYLLLLSATPPPLYPASLVLCGLVLLVALRLDARLERSETPRGLAMLWGVLSGLALWTHLTASSAVVASGLFLAWRSRSAKRRLTLWLPALFALAAASAPLWALELESHGMRKVIRVSRGGESQLSHFVELGRQLHFPLLGLLGAHAPLVADQPKTLVSAPLLVWILLGSAYSLSLFIAWRAASSSPRARLMLVAAGLAVLLFLLPLRSRPHTTRFLTPLYLPVTVCVALASTFRARRRFGLVAALAALHLAGSMPLRAALREADVSKPPFTAPGLEQVEAFLRSQGVSRAFAPYEAAYRLSFETGERLIVSQPWNERFHDFPLPYLDEVRFATQVAWILTPEVATELPEPKRFEAALARAGGAWRREQLGGVFVYYGFAPPFAPTVSVLSPPGLARGVVLHGAATFPLPEARALDGVTVMAGVAPCGLPQNYELDWGSGGTFERAARFGPRAAGVPLAWAGGHLEPASELASIPLGGKAIEAIRIRPVSSAEPWCAPEILLHPTEGPARHAPWQEWLDPKLDWAARRRALAASPRPDSAHWRFRARLASRN